MRNARLGEPYGCVVDVVVVVGASVVEVELVDGSSVVLVEVVGGSVVVGASVDVVVVDAQVQAAVQTSPGAQRNAPPGELGSQGSPGSTTPLPQRSGAVGEEVGEDGVGVVEGLRGGVGGDAPSTGAARPC